MNIRIALASVLCVALAGCGHRYNIRPLKHIQKNEAHFSEKKDNIELRVKKLTPSEVQEIFNGRSVNQSVTVLLVSIRNDSLAPVTFGQEQINLKLVSVKELEQLLFKNIRTRIATAALAIPILVIATTGPIFLFFAGTCCCPCWMLGVLSIGIIDMFIGAPIIVGITANEASEAARFNTHLSHDLKRKILSNIIIEPGAEKSALLFTHELQQPFIIKLMREKEHSTTFTITLKEPETL